MSCPILQDVVHPQKQDNYSAFSVEYFKVVLNWRSYGLLSYFKEIQMEPEVVEVG